MIVHIVTVQERSGDGVVGLCEVSVGNSAIEMILLKMNLEVKPKESSS